MTAPLYVREGSRFVLYDAGRQHTPPLPVPVPVEVEQVVERAAGGWSVPVHRCPHGHYSRPGGPGRGCRRCSR